MRGEHQAPRGRWLKELLAGDRRKPLMSDWQVAMVMAAFAVPAGFFIGEGIATVLHWLHHTRAR